MTDKPESVHLAYDETFVEFFCDATSDDSTPVTIRWYQTDRHRLMRNLTDQVNVTVSGDGRMLSFMVRANDTVGWASLTGHYQCVAFNGYSSEVANFSVTIEPLPTPLYLVNTTPRGNQPYTISVVKFCERLLRCTRQFFCLCHQQFVVGGFVFASRLSGRLSVVDLSVVHPRL